MVLSSLDPWMRELNHASKLADEVSDMIFRRGSLPSPGPQSQRHMSTARRKMTILRTKLETLQSLLPDLPNKQRITTWDMNRRKDMLNNLRLKAGEMAPTLNMSISTDRDNLLGVDRKQDDVMKVADELDNRGLVSFQRQIMKEQDEDLAKLEANIASTKHIALAVNEELDLHTRLLGDLDEHVESTDSHLQRLQRRVSSLNSKTKGDCFTYVLLLLAVMVLMVIIWFLLNYL